MLGDWTYDQFMEDVKEYKAEDINSFVVTDETYRKYFMCWFKNAAETFKEEWLKKHEHMYDTYDGYIGDSFSRTLYSGWFSDFYKDAYGQRPHLPMWYYVHALGLPMQEDVSRTFCASPVKDAMDDAIAMREYFRS